MTSFLREDTHRQGYPGYARRDWVVVYKLIHDAQTDARIVVECSGVTLRGQWPTLTVEESVQLEEQIARARIHAIHLALTAAAPLTEAEIDQTLGAIPRYKASV